MGHRGPHFSATPILPHACAFGQEADLCEPIPLTAKTVRRLAVESLNLRDGDNLAPRAPFRGALFQLESCCQQAKTCDSVAKSPR